MEIVTNRYNLKYEYNENKDDPKYFQYTFNFNNSSSININVILCMPGKSNVDSKYCVGGGNESDITTFNCNIPITVLLGKKYNEYTDEEITDFLKYLDISNRTNFNDIITMRNWLYCVKTSLYDAIEDNLVDSHTNMMYLYNFFKKN